jgi:hypothetical protein
MTKNKITKYAIPLTLALYIILFSDIAAAEGFEKLTDLADGLIKFADEKLRPLIEIAIVCAGGFATYKIASPYPLLGCAGGVGIFEFLAKSIS